MLLHSKKIKKFFKGLAKVRLFCFIFVGNKNRISMNAKIMGTKVEDLLFIDIECVRAQKELDINSYEFELFQYKNRDKMTGELLPDSDVITLYNKSAALSPIHGKIICISVGYITDTKFISKNIIGEEKDILTEFFTLLNSVNKAVAGFNIVPFDLNYCLLRAASCGIDVILKDSINTLGKKEWNLTDKNLDLFLVLKGTGYQSHSLQEIAYLLGVKSSKDDIAGHMVSEVYWSEGVERIAKYCAKDILCTAEIFLALQGKRNFITEVVDKTGVKAEKTPLMNTIANTKEITKDQEKELVAKAKTLSKEEKAISIELLKAALLENSDKYEKLFTKLLK
jgi:DNA polymerase elongation subunit (family B)